MAGTVSEKIGGFAFIFISTSAEYYFPAKLYQLSMFVLISYILFINFKITWKTQSVLPTIIKVISPF